MVLSEQELSEHSSLSLKFPLAAFARHLVSHLIILLPSDWLPRSKSDHPHFCHTCHLSLLPEVTDPRVTLAFVNSLSPVTTHLLTSILPHPHPSQSSTFFSSSFYTTRQLRSLITSPVISCRSAANASLHTLPSSCWVMK